MLICLDIADNLEHDIKILLLYGEFKKFSLTRLRLVSKVATVAQKLLYAVYSENHIVTGKNIEPQDWKGPLKVHLTLRLCSRKSISGGLSAYNKELLKEAY